VHLFARRQPFGTTAFAPGLRFWGLGGDAASWDRLDVGWSVGDLDTMASMVVSVADAVGLDVLHFHYAVPFARIVHEARDRLTSGPPRTIGTLHGTDVSVHAADPRVRPQLQRHLASLDEVTTVSQAHAALAERTLELGSAPTVIPNFVDLNRFRPPPHEGPRGRRPRIAYVSNFRAVKDPQSAARVFIGIRRHIDAELWLVGDGEEMRSTRRLLRQAGVDGDVRFFGLRPDVEQILPLADLLLVTSRSESFCLAALEAAASGVPVVATHVGGLPEVVLDGETGFLFEPDDVAAAVRAVCRLLRDDRLRSEMARAALDRAELFSTDVVIPRYEALYADLVDEPAMIRQMVAVGARLWEGVVR